MNRAVLSLGANQGDRQHQLASALLQIQPFATLEAVSSLYETAPVGNLEQPDFLNIAVAIRTDLDVRSLHRRLRQIETTLGRVRNEPGGPRRIDIDIVFYEDWIIEEDDLTVPHPRYADRNFVLSPMNEIVPDWMCPLRRQTVAVIHRLCTDASRVRKIATGWFERMPA